MNREFKDVVVGTFLGIVACAILSLLIGCKTVTKTEYVDRYHTVHDTIHSTIVKRDSVALRDSIFLYEYVKGDTVYKYKYVERSGQKDRVVRDSVYLHKTDTVFVDKQTEKTTVKGMTLWQKLLVLGLLFILVLIVSKKKGVA